jgi:hypothetical protein
MNSPPKLFEFCKPRLSASEFSAMSRKPCNEPTFGRVSNLTCTTTTVTSTRITAVSKNLDTVRKISNVISSLRDTHLNFNKIQNLQKKRLKHLQNLVKRKNEIISQLATQLELFSNAKSLNSNLKICQNKYLGVVRCNNVIRTVFGSEKFVRRRLAELCTLHKAEYIYCAICTGEERQQISQLLSSTFLTRVIVYEKNRRFEFLQEDEAHKAQTLIIDYFNNESRTKIDSD